MSRRVLLIAGLALLGCSPPPAVSPDSGVTGSDDITPPRVVATVPPSGAQQVPAAEPISFEFSEAMDPNQLTLTAEPSADLGPARWSFQDTLVTFTPAAPLSYATAYTVRVSGRDLAGIALVGETAIQFTTEPSPDTAAPAIVSTTPASGAGGVSVQSSIGITFSKPMDVGTVILTIKPAVALSAPVWSGYNRTVTYAPASGLASLTSYSVVVEGSDTLGLSLAPNTGFDFTTEQRADTNPPLVMSTAPSNGATDVPPTSAISVLFSEPMTRASTEAALSSSPNLVCTFTWDAQSTRMTCTPSTLAGSTVYRLSVGTGARDLAGNPLSSPYGFMFVTGTGADTTPPTIVSSNPQDGAIGVVPETNIEVTFSEPMDPTSTQGAFAVTSPAGVTGAFSWDPTGTRMTFDPASNLPHRVSVSWTVGSGARDLAGNPMAQVTRVFRVANLMQTTLYSIAALDGYVTSGGAFNATLSTLRTGDLSLNQAVRSFVTFNLSGLPANLVRIEGATFSVYQSTSVNSPYSLGALYAASVYYGGSLDAADFNEPVLNNQEQVLSTTVGAGYRSVAVDAKVIDDWNNRSTRGGYSQFRLYFKTATNNNSLNDLTYVYSGEYGTAAYRPRLMVRFLSP